MGEEEGKVTAEEALAPQLGTDTIDLMRGRINPARLSNINDIEKLWMSYFMSETLVPKEDGGDAAREFIEKYLNLAMSVGGRRVTQMIQMVAGSKGAASGVELVKKPGWFTRNILKRKWKEEAEEEGKIIVE